MIREKWFFVPAFALVGVLLLGAVSHLAAQVPQAVPSPALVAIDRAAKANRYLFIFFYRGDDQQTKAMGQVFNEATNAVANRADPMAVRVTDPAEAELVKRFGVAQAPMPLVLVLAPNGALTASYPEKFTREQLVNSFASPSMEKASKVLQQGKLVLLCVQNGKTKWNAEAMTGVRAFKADQRYNQATEVLMLDPGHPAEGPFLQRLGMNAAVDEAMTVFLAPPGSVIGSFKGATDKNQLVNAVTKAVSSCGPGSQPGCCGVGQ